MSGAVRQLKRRPASRPAGRSASRPAPRTVTVSISKGDFEGWEATARADFPAKYLEDLSSGNVVKIIAVLDAVIIDHNFPTSEDEIAATMADVDPYDGLLKVAGEIFDAIGKLPNR